MKNGIAKKQKPDKSQLHKSANAVVCQVPLDYKQVQLISSAYLVVRGGGK